MPVRLSKDLQTHGVEGFTTADVPRGWVDLPAFVRTNKGRESPLPHGNQEVTRRGTAHQGQEVLDGVGAVGIVVDVLGRPVDQFGRCRQPR